MSRVQYKRSLLPLLPLKSGSPLLGTLPLSLILVTPCTLVPPLLCTLGNVVITLLEGDSV